MRKAQNQTSRENYSPKRGTFTGNRLQNHVHTNPPQENQTVPRPPTASSTYSPYSIVTLGILFVGMIKSDTQLLYLAGSMALAPLGSSKLKFLLPFIKEIFEPKAPKK